MIVAKQMPPRYFYGVPGVRFIWRGAWNDPAIEYRGRTYNYYLLEDTLWDMYTDENPGATENNFPGWVVHNKELVYELLNLQREERN